MIQRNPNSWVASNWIYRADADRAYRITRVRLESEEIVGEYLCRTGFTTGERCGTIKYRYATISVDGRTLTSQTVTTICALPGDSGGPYYIYQVGYGMSSAGTWHLDAQGRPTCSGPDTLISTYTPLSRVQTRTSTTVRTS